MPRIKSTVASFLLGLAFWAGAAEAQCPLPDNLDGGPCCTLTQLRLPKFPAFTHQALDICWQNCAVSQLVNVRTSWTAPVPPPQLFPTVPPPCNILMSGVTVFTPLGAVAWRGTLRLQYSRTWVEAGPGTGFQVWRFLVNGELNPTAAAGPIPCPVPSCAPVFNNRVRWTGYIDYARDCATQAWSQAWMLNHECDFIDHAPGFPRAGAFHPDRSYTFVGPAAGFVPATGLPVEAGGIALEAVRRVNLPVAPVVGSCEFEEPVAGGAVVPVLGFCPCSTGPAVAQYVQSNLFVNGVCGTAVASGAGPFLPGFISKSLGSWTIAAAFPGIEDLRWNCGNYNYVDPCTTLTQSEVFYGVSTRGGFPAFQVTAGGVGGALPPTFVDQSNSLTFPALATTMNIQYVSNHVLNLNLP